MLKFILRDKPKRFEDCEVWEIVLLGHPNINVAQFIGGDWPWHLDKDVAPLVAGDYVEFLNEKYFDKGIPPRTKQQQMEYHLQRAAELKTELMIENMKCD